MAEWFAPLRDTAKWIWLPRDRSAFAPPIPRDEVVLFHGALAPPAGTHSVELHVSAEGRYALWLNDEADPLGHGPARTDRQHRTLDTYSIDVSGAGGAEKALHVWSQVRWWAGPPEAPLAEMQGSIPGFVAIVLFLDESGRIIEKTGTGAAGSNWLVRECTGISGSPLVNIPGFFAVGDFEHQRSSGWPADWRKAAVPREAGWVAPAENAGAYFKRDPDVTTGPGNPSWLVQREIAHTEYRPLPIQEVRKLVSSSPTKPDASPAYEPVNSLTHLKFKPNESVTLRCDVGEYAIGYYRMRLAGKGTKLSVTSSEVLSGGLARSTADPKVMVMTKKAFTLDSPLDLLPFIDTYTLDTDQARTLEGAHWRAFRFLELKLEAGPGGGELETFTLHATGYPFEADYSFEASATGSADAAEIVRKMVDVSWRTLKCCTWETYMDCPYYEQLQYLGDTRLQCLITYLTSGDTALPVQALRAFDRSRIYEGLTQSRYPSHGMQIIPPFSLIYIMMIEDYLNYVGDDAVVAEVRPGIAPILNWYTQYSDPETGLIGYTPYWPVVDWVNGWDTGNPPHGGKGPGFSKPEYSGSSSIINLLHVMAVQAAANIYERAKAGSGNFLNSRAAALRQRIKDTFFDAGRGLMCDIPLEAGRGKVGVWSQHAQALAVLADVLSPTEARTAMAICLDAKNVYRADEPVSDVEGAKAGKYGGRYISPASIYFLFYVAEALAKLRMGEQVWAIWSTFRAALERGSTTWPESLEPSRSECHAWSAWPLYFFARHILGISPPSLQDNKVRVQPLECPPLTSAKGHFQTHRGPVKVEVSWENGERKVNASGLGVEVVKG